MTKIERALSELPDDADRVALGIALKNPAVPAENVSHWLGAKGHPVSASTIRTYRRELRFRNSVDWAQT